MSFFEKNMQRIKERDIVLYDQVQLQQERPLEHVMTETARDGNTYLKRKIRGEWVALNSTYHPLAEAERFARAYQGQPLYARLLVFGLGNGYIARELLAKNPLPVQDTADGVYSHVRYAFYEPDAVSFLYVLHTYDLTDILENPDVSIFVEGCNENLLAGWCNRNVAQLNVSAFQYLALPKYRENYGEAYERILGIYKDMVACVEADTLTKKEFVKDMVYNNLRHLQYFAQAQSLSAFARRFPKQLPYIIVSAGPSLRSNLHELRQMQPYAFLMSTDSAAKYLIDEGIVPDGIMVIDPRKPVSLFDMRMCTIPFFVHTDSNVRVLDAVKPEKLYYIGTYMAYYEELAVGLGDRICYLDTGGSVATAAFSLAEELELETVVLIGQDLSVQGNTSHVAGQNRHVVTYQEVPGNEAESLETSFDYYMYLQWFQNHIAENRRLHVINATKGGARISGTEYLHGEVLYAKICTEENRRAIAAMRAEEKQSAGRAGTAMADVWYQALERDFGDLETGIQTAGRLVARAKQCIAAGAYHTRDFYEINEKIQAENAKIQETLSHEWLELCARGEEDSLIGDLYQQEEDAGKDLLDAYQKMDAYYKMLLEARKQMLELLEERKHG